MSYWHKSLLQVVYKKRQRAPCQNCNLRNINPVWQYTSSKYKASIMSCLLHTACIHFLPRTVCPCFMPSVPRKWATTAYQGIITLFLVRVFSQLTLFQTWCSMSDTFQDAWCCNCARRNEKCIFICILSDLGLCAHAGRLPLSSKPRSQTGCVLLNHYLVWNKICEF